MERFGRRFNGCCEDLVDDETARRCGAILIGIHHHDGGSWVVGASGHEGRLTRGCHGVRSCCLLESNFARWVTNGAVVRPEGRLSTRRYSWCVGEKKVTGPASYFPSIEKTYGKPISHWKSLLKKMKSARHSEMVAMLKSDHGLGHGHANAIVAHFRAEEGL